MVCYLAVQQRLDRQVGGVHLGRRHEVRAHRAKRVEGLAEDPLHNEDNGLLGMHRLDHCEDDPRTPTVGASLSLHRLSHCEDNPRTPIVGRLTWHAQAGPL